MSLLGDTGQAMSKENVEAVRETYAAWERGDNQLILNRTHPEIGLVQPPEVPGAKSYHGHRGVIEMLENWPNGRSSSGARVIEVDEDRVISVTCHRMKAREMDVAQEVFYLHTSEDGLATRMDMFFSRAQVLEAAGLSE